MDNLNMMQRLKEAGIAVEPGMTAAELDRAEAVFGFRFPREIREFLSCGVPVGRDFFDYRDVSEANRKRFWDFKKRIEDDFRFDLENNRDIMLELLAEPLGNPADFDAAVLEYLHSSVKLIPFYAHRCFFDGVDDMPIVSFWQPTDSIFYGYDFQEYLEKEFLGQKDSRRELPADFSREMGIWYQLLMQ